MSEHTPNAPQFNQAPAKSKVVAGILGILLGTFGIHNFYLGHKGKAIAQLLITVLSVGFLAFVSGIWGLIEGILILISKPGTPWHQDAQGNELND
ncbi:TM2 domain-containing protein [Timonella sp. A28]|uniref:TM2 domain-containing protein n=1 Tax=Timonella sp. A28 TaxID=3442640 RepID=UPI003EB7B8D1